MTLEDAPAASQASRLARLAAADALLAELLDLDAAGREARLAATRGSDPELAREAEELLALALAPDSGGLAGRMAAAPLWREIARHLAPGQRIAPDQRLGPWRIVREIGRGGMAVVALAERADGLYEQRAAIKFFAAGAESPEALARFERERRILAALDHSGIGRLLDGGVDPSGRPFLVIEYVEGEPIDAYCDRLRLGVDERLRLFSQVLEAVDYAHRHLVVHRDLKPSNILVGHDGRAKLLDFGIAKLLAPEGEEPAPATRTAARVFTLDWASPEQIRGEAITTASDVYQLGLLLYELLCGRRAYRVPRTSLLEAEKAIVGREPRPPSELADDSELARSAAERRSTSPGALARRLRGDLDAVTLKALRKRPDRRYSGPAEFAADLALAARGLPVRARDGTFAYRAGRFLARHRAALAATGAVLALLVGWALTATLQARRLERESAGRAAVTAFLTGMFRDATPGRRGDEELTARDLVDRGVERLDRELADRPELRAELLFVLAEIRSNLGFYAEGIPLYERALALQPVARLADDPRLAAEHRKLADLRHYLGDVERAERDLGELVRRTRAAEGAAGRRELAVTLASWGDALHSLGRYAEARPALEEARALFAQHLAEDDPLHVQALRPLADLERDTGRLGPAGELYARSLRLLENRFGPRNASVPWVMSGEALRLVAAGRLDDAGALLARAQAISDEIFEPDHALRAMVLERRAVYELARGRWEVADALATEAEGAYRRRLGEASFCFVRVALLRGEAALGAGRPAEARRLGEQARALLAAHGRLGHPFAARADRLLAAVPPA